jgi:hypothetical protein
LITWAERYPQLDQAMRPTSSKVSRPPTLDVIVCEKSGQYKILSPLIRYEHGQRMDD